MARREETERKSMADEAAAAGERGQGSVEEGTLRRRHSVDDGEWKEGVDIEMH